MSLNKYQRANRKAWDSWTTDHLETKKEVIETVRTGGLSLAPVELEEVGNVSGKTLLHLMCHIGTDSLSWSRQGALVTGVDFSQRSIEVARSLAEEMGLDARFIQSEFHDTPTVLSEEFDIVYMSMGVLCWLPSTEAWARVVTGFLKPGGIFYLREIHPILWSLAQDREDGLLVIEDDYFETGTPHVDEESQMGESSVQVSYGWSHGLGDITSSLIGAGLRIEFLHEHQATSSGWDFMLDMQQRTDGMWELCENRGRLPLEYTIRATK